MARASPDACGRPSPSRGRDEGREHYFADRLLGDAEIRPDGEHGLFGMTVVEAIHRSGETGGRVEIETR